MPEPTNTILVVDDNEAERYFVARVLAKAGFHVQEAATGMDALRLAAGVPDLVTLDVRLPDLSGFEVCRRIKESPATRDVAVLHISASFTTSDAKAEGLEGGADGYLTHPVNPNELVATVRALLRTRHAEAQVRAAAREWTATFDLIGDAVCLTGEDGLIVRCNAAFARLAGRRYTALIGKPLQEIVPELRDLGPEPAGTPAQVRIGERHFRVSRTPGTDGSSQSGRAWVLGDITERYRNEEALRRSQDEAQARLQEIEAVYSSAPVGLCVLDSDLRYVRVNQRLAEINGRSIEAHAGRTVREVVPEFADFLEPKLREVLATGRPVFDLELRGETAAQPGVERVWVVTWLPLTAADGRTVGINIAAEEVTEQRRLQQTLQESQRLEAVGRLAGGVAHETNNQMTVVLGCAGFILRHPTTPELIRADVEQIRTAAERTARITAQLLAFGRRQHLHPELIDLDSVVRRLQPILQRALGDRSDLVVQAGSEGERVRADVGQLEQVLLNLTLNARDAMPEGGTLTVRTVPVRVASERASRTDGEEIRPGNYVCMVVSDTGHGMEPETLRRAFEPFFTTKDPGKGTGLGLSMVHGVVKQSGGYIRAASAVGQGTRIEIYLPRVDSKAEESAGGTPASTSGVTGHVLVVEDDPLVRAVVVRELVAQGFRVTEAADGATALERATHTSQRFDIVITDLAMPRMDGRELAKRLAQVQPGLPVLFMSGHAEEAATRQLEESGQAYLPKPFTAEELVQRIEETLRRSG
jgi:two-component system cell cycle sensor histidine kinase/response regulator CckA